MRPVVVLADLASQAVNEVRQISFDWYLSGLVQPIIWLDITPGERTITAIINGQPKRIALSVWLDKYLAADHKVELYSLQIANEEGSYFTEREIDAALRDFPILLAAEPSIVNVIAPSSEVQSIPETVLVPYRTNIVVLPIQGASGYAGYKVLQPTSSEFFANATSGLASSTGTWTGMATNPLYDLQLSKQRKPEVLLLRSFARYADASGLAMGIADELTSETPGLLPCAFDDKGEKLTPNAEESSKEKAIKVANNFVAQNQKMFELSSMPSRPELSPKPLGWRELLGQYFSYLAKYFKPGQWLREKVDGYKAAAANSLQQIFLGDYSAREVFVAGVSSDTPRNDDSTLNAIEALLNATNSVSSGVMEPQLTNPNDIWRDYVTTIAALVDGSSGVEEIELPGVLGGDRRLILNPVHLAPAPGHPNFRIPESLPIPLKGEVVRPADPYLAMLLERQLDDLLLNAANYSAVDVAAAQKTRFDLRLWIEEVDSFSWRVGRKLADSLNRARDLLGKIPSSLGYNDESHKELVELESKARKALGRVFKGMLGILGVALTAWLAQALWLLAAFGAWPIALAVGWYWPVAAVAALVGIWGALGLQAFAGAVRDIYKFENKAQFDIEIAKWVETIRPTLRTEVAKLSDLYRQLEMWNRIIVPVLYQPLGKPPVTKERANSIKNLNQLTSAIQLAELKTTGEQKNQLLEKVKSEFLRRGWLTRRIHNHLEELGAELPKTWSDTAQEDKSSLRRILTNIASKDTAAMLGHETFEQIQQIAMHSADYVNWPVKILNLERELSCEEYLTGLARGVGALPVEFLSDAAAVAGLNRIDQERSQFVIDSRISAASDVSKTESSQNAVDPLKRLDMISVRVEVTRPIKFAELLAIAPIDMTHQGEVGTEPISPVA